MPLEIACFSIESASIALLSGVDRIELCSHREAGGLTPSEQDLKDILAFRMEIGSTVPIYVMIRPRDGNFVYSNEEFTQMQISLESLRKIGADGFVFGILDFMGHIDVDRNRELVKLGGLLPCTFHRAFDQIHNQRSNALNDIRTAGFATVLTSGGAANVVIGQDTLKALLVEANWSIVIMPGGGLRSSNLKELRANLPAKWWHSSAIVGSGNEADGEEIKALESLIS